jgi:hypothetical protein
MKGTIKVLNAKGHSEVTYDTEEGVVEEAEAILEGSSRANASIFDGKTKERIDRSEGNDTILKTHEEIIVVPQMAGG